MKKIVLYASPREKKPYLDTGKIKRGEYEESPFKFGNFPFTDFGISTWNAMKEVYKAVDMDIEKSFFGWRVTMCTPKLSVKLHYKKYSIFSSVIYIKMEVEGEKYVINRFIWRLIKAYGKEPWKGLDWEKLRKKGIKKEKVIDAWKKYIKYVKEEKKVKKKKVKKEGPDFVAEPKIVYEDRAVVYKLHLKNNSRNPYKNLNIKFELDDEFFSIEKKEENLQILKPHDFIVLLNRLIPKKEAINKKIWCKISYTKEDREITVESDKLEINIKYPEISSKDIDKEMWKKIASGSIFLDEKGKILQTSASEFHQNILEEVKNWEFSIVDVSVDRRGKEYNGNVLLYGEDEEKNGYCLSISAIGDNISARGIVKIYVKDKEKAVGFYNMMKKRIGSIIGGQEN
ncbi:MAG: hypothetical protein AB1779_11305 [Candidatus Thermoplasmatota archaeon]